MDLFDKKEKGKDILSQNSVFIHFKSNGKFDVLVEGSVIKITPRGFTNSINKGLTGQKTYDVNNLEFSIRLPALLQDFCRLFSLEAVMLAAALWEL